MKLSSKSNPNPTKPETFKAGRYEQWGRWQRVQESNTKIDLFSYDQAMIIIKNDDVAFNTKMEVFIIKESNEVQHSFPSKYVPVQQQGNVTVMAAKLYYF